MIKEKAGEALNLQMNREFFNSSLYLAMAAYFDSINMEGATSWMEKQAEEERGHAFKIYNHLKERGATIKVGEVAAPPQQWDSPLAAFEAAYEHECKVSSEFDELMALADAEKDNATKIFLQWFINEQVEEEASVDGIIQKLKMAQNAPGGIMMIDRMLAQRAAH